MRSFGILVLLVSLAACATIDKQGDLAAARRVFERNIQAIQDKDKSAYLGCYRQDEALVRMGPEGPKHGFEGLATQTSTAPESWPVRLEAEDMSLSWIRPGVVFGSYRYRVVFEAGEDAVVGVSERLFIEHDGEWQIAVTTAFPRCP